MWWKHRVLTTGLLGNSPNNCSLWIILSRKSNVQWKNWPADLSAQDSSMCAFPPDSCTRVFSRRAFFMCNSHFITQNFRKSRTLELRFLNIKNFTALGRIFFSKTGFPLQSVWECRMQRWLGIVWGHRTDACWVISSLLHHGFYFYTFRANANTEKETDNRLISFLKKFWPCRYPWSSSWIRLWELLL